MLLVENMELLKEWVQEKGMVDILSSKNFEGLNFTIVLFGTE